ncbi:hypothetical protein [Hymenobacter siberiensis]|uniref:hypothetical protein n=1 Tax=Hymenobacter siberiensis TaxID=2848396 RepID=UPI001C1E0A1A|nr:hypothetical protein [Hymenobacter siberiensis]MBU6119684.1 hypothetical protein [Hymenobacter siberiensis]
MVCLLLATTAGHAQTTQPEPQTKPVAPASAPNQLSPQKMEEALRLLLRADSVASQRQRAHLGSGVEFSDRCLSY